MGVNDRPYRLGLDLGSNSIGWFAIWLGTDGPCGLGAGGVRVFPDGRVGKSKASNAATRRAARSMRRTRDRYLKRRSLLMDRLIAHGLMPPEDCDRKALEKLDPYKLRARGLDRALPLHRVGRALFHLNQRRGFRSNRKTDVKTTDSGAIRQAVSRLEEAMADDGARTLGEFLWCRRRQSQVVRSRNTGTATRAAYDFYPSRALVEQEFERLWDAQAPHHPRMTPEARRDIHDAIFFQRDLRPQPVGKCTLDPARSPDDEDGFRLAWAHPLAQRFRILQEVNNLRYGETGHGTAELDADRRARLTTELSQRKELKFDRIRALLELPAASRFNLESERRDKLKGDETAAKMGHRDLFGRRAWRAMPQERQIAVVERLLGETDEDRLIDWLETEIGVSGEAARRICNVSMPEGHAFLGLRAIRKLLPEMERGLRYDEAATRAYGHHSQLATGEILPRLPYYGEWLSDAVTGSGDPADAQEKRWGRLPNPTVHIGLGQLRRVVNALVRRYGPPAEVVIEMTREFKLSPDRLRELERDQEKNQKKNEDRKKKIAEHVAPTGELIFKMRLWEELNLNDPMDRRCPFSGELISIRRLLSDETEVEHIIPFGDSWDDSPANKTVAMRFANRAKGKRAPHDAFGGNPTIQGRSYRWDSIARRAASLPANKRWRFEPDAMAKFAAQGGFLARQLNDTGYFATLAKRYVEALVPDKGKVWVVPGRLTAMIRGKWGLDHLLPDREFTGRKNRADHRHHAIDALVAGLTDRSLLQRMASAYDDERKRIEIPSPWEGFNDELKEALERMIVSHRMDHATSGKLHESTAYGIGKKASPENRNPVYRIDITALAGRRSDRKIGDDAEVEKVVGRVFDHEVRDMLRNHMRDQRGTGSTYKAALANFNDVHGGAPHIRQGIRRVRVTETLNPKYLVRVKDAEGRNYKAYSYDINAYVDVVETPDGAWIGEATTNFNANTKEYRPDWRNRRDVRFIMRVRKGDMIAVEDGGMRKIMVVVRLEEGLFRLACHHEAGNMDARHKDPKDTFRWKRWSYNALKSKRAERVRVDELGRVWRVSPEESFRSVLNEER